MKIKQVFKRIVAGVLATATLLTSMSLPAFAEKKYNGTGGGKTYYVEGDIPGTTEGNWGYRFAIVDAKTGKVQQNPITKRYLVKDQMQYAKLDENLNNAYKDNFVRTDPNTNLGEVGRDYGLFKGQPAPITTKDGTWVGQGSAFKDWMMKEDGCVLPNGKKTSWAENIINVYFGKQVKDEVLAGKYKLVVEPIYIIPLYTDFLSYKVSAVNGSDNYYSIENEDGTRSYSSYSGIHYFGTYAGSLKALYNLPQLMTKSSAIGGGGGYQSLAVRASAKCMYLDEDDYNPYC